jgi:hypothetical protein
MLDAFIIHRIQKAEEGRRPQPQPLRIEAPQPPPHPPEDEDDPVTDRGVAEVDFEI